MYFLVFTISNLFFMLGTIILTSLYCLFYYSKIVVVLLDVLKMVHSVIP